MLPPLFTSFDLQLLFQSGVACCSLHQHEIKEITRSAAQINIKSHMIIANLFT